MQNFKKVVSMKPGPKSPMQSGPITLGTQIECNCGGTIFQMGIQIFYLSPVISPTGKPHINQMPGWVCCSCRKMNDFKETPEISELFDDSGKLKPIGMA